MSRRSRPHYHSGLEWILGVAFEDTLTRPARLAQGFTHVRCCGSPRASSPHGLAAQRWRLATAGTACSCLQLAVATTSPRDGLSPPIQRPCQAHLRRFAPRNDGLTATLPYTVAIGVTGEPTAPGRRSGGAVKRKRERPCSRSQFASGVSRQISPSGMPFLNKQCSCSGRIEQQSPPSEAGNASTA